MDYIHNILATEFVKLGPLGFNGYTVIGMALAALLAVFTLT